MCGELTITDLTTVSVVFAIGYVSANVTRRQAQDLVEPSVALYHRVTRYGTWKTTWASPSGYAVRLLSRLRLASHLPR